MKIRHVVFAEKSGCIFSSFLVVQLMISQANSAHYPNSF